MSADFRSRWEELKALRGQRSRLLLELRPKEAKALEERNRQLANLERRINDLATLVGEKLPAWRELQQRDRSTPTDLQRVLPPGTVFVDLHHYTFIRHDPAKQARVEEKGAERYGAFLITRQDIRFLDLGPAAPIDAALQRWREALTRREAPPGADISAPLRRLVWEPLEKHFPQGTATVYLCPDQALCFLPWAAQPGKQPNTVLLEDYCLAIVPDGPRLLSELNAARTPAPKRTESLVLGGVSYDEMAAQPAVPSAIRPVDKHLERKSRWPLLPGTRLEAEIVVRLASQRQKTNRLLAGRDASTERIKTELAQARHAHLATHGFFADAQFRSVFQMDEALFAMRGNERVGIGALNPSVLSGLVFAGANRPETPGRGILTAEELLDVDLTGMELTVLSACETGVGDIKGAGGEGVFGLQRAFHVAGCGNVIASLWKVNDVATLVLMEEFYRNLWEKRLSKREALRLAQLTVYRKPDLVEKRRQEILAALKKAGATKEDLALRGIEEEAAPLPAAGPGVARRSPAAWWAAFVLSGVGD